MDSGRSPGPPGGKRRRICRAAFPKPGFMPISMKKHQNFDWAAGFCEPRPSARLVSSTENAAALAYMVSGLPGTSED